MKYVIIGNGIVALTTAFRLTQKIGSADSIHIIGPTERPGSATLAAAAMLNSFAEISEGSLQSDEDMYHFELSHTATRMWPEFEEELIAAAGDDLPTGCAKCEILGGGGCYNMGTYVINNSASDELDDRNFDAIVGALDDFNEQHELVDPKTIPNYYPAQDKRATRAVLIHNEGWLNPRLVIEKLDAILDNHAQVTRYDTCVDALSSNKGKIVAAKTSDGQSIEGDVFLLANGANAGQTLKNSALGIKTQPIFYGLGVSLEIKSPGYPHTHCIRTPNRGGACGIYTVPYFWGPDHANDHVIIGASNQLSVVPVPNGRLVSIAHLMHAATEEINGHFYNAQLVRTNFGWRPTTQDTYPLLGRSSIDNLVIATGTKRDGFHLSPLISDQMSDIMLGNEVDERLAMYAPERDVIHDLSREDAIKMGVDGWMSEQYQHGYSPSNIRMNEQIRQNVRADLEKLHDDVGAKDWGIPPELVNMYRNGHTV